jgi:hypothetical protein
VPANTYGQYLDLDFLAGFCSLGFRGTTARALMAGLDGFLPGSFCFGLAFGSDMFHTMPEPPTCASSSQFKLYQSPAAWHLP